MINNRLRILHLIPQSKLGGAELYGFNLSSALAQRGHDVILLSNRNNGPLLERPHPSNMQVRALNRTNRLDPRMLTFLLHSFRSFKPHIVHAHNFEASTWARAIGLFHPSSRLIVHIHSSRFVYRHTRQRVIIDKLLNRRVDAVICLNAEQESYILEHLHLPPHKLHRMVNGIDIEHYHRLPTVSPDPYSAVCVASLTDVKNHSCLLDAWKLVLTQFPTARLTLVGDGPLRPNIEHKVRSLGIGSRVVLTGAIQDIRQALWKSAIFVLPSLHEALPLSLVEAMSAGLACIASSVGGIPELLQYGKCGKLIPPGDVQALASAMIELFADPQGRATIAQDAMLNASSHYSLQAAVDRLEGLYQEVLDRRPGGRILRH